MNRFQKKCLIASALLHGLLMVVLVSGTAFFNSKEKISDSPHIIEIIPANAVITDNPTRGGGSPAPAPIAVAPEVKPAEITPPKPTPPAPKPEPEPEPEPEPPKPVVEAPTPKPIEPKETVSEIPIPKKPKKTLPEPVSISKPTTKTSTKPAPIKRNIDISKPTVLNSKERQVAAEKAQRAADQRIQAGRISALNSSLKNLGKNLSSGTTIEMPGSGGGQAEINYGDLVLSKYDAAWFAPDEVDENVAIVKARVVIARNGSVISATIVKASGNATLDSSVRNALKLKFIEAFPAGSIDSQRTYIINFNLKSKRGLG